MSQMTLQVVSRVLKIEKQETAKETSDGNGTLGGSKSCWKACPRLCSRS